MINKSLAIILATTITMLISLQVVTSAPASLEDLINNADPYSTIYIEPGTYIIDKSLVIDKPLIIRGSGINDTIITTSNRGAFLPDDNPAFIWIKGTNDVEISDIWFKGPAISNEDIMDGSLEIHGGQGNQAAIKLGVAANHDVKIHDCKFSLLLGDAVASGTAEDYNIEIYNNTVDTAGHDCLQLWNDYNCTIYNNFFGILCNCGIRLANCDNCTIINNTFTNSLQNSGWACIELEYTSTNHNICNNTFKDTTDNIPIAGWEFSGYGITLCNNSFINTPSPAIAIPDDTYSECLVPEEPEPIVPEEPEPIVPEEPEPIVPIEPVIQKEEKHSGSIRFDEPIPEETYTFKSIEAATEVISQQEDPVLDAPINASDRTAPDKCSTKQVIYAGIIIIIIAMYILYKRRARQ